MRDPVLQIRVAVGPVVVLLLLLLGAEALLQVRILPAQGRHVGGAAPRRLSVGLQLQDGG